MSNKIVGHAISLLLGAALMGGTAIGQNTQQSQGQQSQGQQSQGQQSQGQQDSKSDKAARGATRQAGPAGVIPLGITIEEQARVLEGWRASKLVGATVYNDQGQRIGKIEDMLVSPDGKLSVAVIDVGGFLGIGKHRVAIPVDQFSDITAKKLVLPKATKETLKALPEFRYA
jgi:sporulation protein YlmC with PRC-barrel domain